MVRKILLQLLPFLLPFIAYGIWLLIVRWRGGKPPAHTPWAPLVFSGFVLMGASLVGLALLAPEDQEGSYVPARYQDGKIIPGEVQPAEEQRQ